jgi:hypothetical protein
MLTAAIVVEMGKALCVYFTCPPVVLDTPCGIALLKEPQFICRLPTSVAGGEKADGN